MYVLIPTTAATPETATRAVAEMPARPDGPSAADAASASVAQDQNRQSDARHGGAAAIAAPKSKAPRAPLDVARLAILMLASAWIAGVGYGALGLIVGGRRLARLVRTAVAPSQAAMRQFEACQLVSGVRTRVTLKMHPEVASPMLACARPRCILVPDHWETLPEATQRAVLLHELAHVARRDDQVKLLEEAVRVLFFFHPLVHYLLHRLDREREEVCDAMALHQGVSPRALAEILLDYGRRMSHESLAVTGARAPVFPAAHASDIAFSVCSTIKVRSVGAHPPLVYSVSQRVGWRSCCCWSAAV